MNRHFSKDIYEANKHEKMLIKTTLRCHLTSVRMAIIKKSGDNRCWERMWRNWNVLTQLVGE